MAFGDKKLYIASKIDVEIDKHGNEIAYFDVENLKEYRFSYMPVGSQVDYQIYGTLINNLFSSYLPMSFLGKIRSGDIAYLIDGETQDIDTLVKLDKNNKYCPNANYRVKLVQPQNVRLKVLFEKIKFNN